MASGSESRVIHAPARVVVNPTTSLKTSAFPFGGTEVGLTSQVAFADEGESFEIFSEGLGEVTDILQPNNSIRIGMFLRGWDDDAVAQFLKGGYSAGAFTQHAVFTSPGERRPGQSMVEADNSLAVLLAIIPEDVIHVPAMLVYVAVPQWTPAAEMAFQHDEELGIPITFRALRNGSGNIYQTGIAADLSLT